ncbi:MAG: hypothetical protein ACUVQ5_05885 [Candidatus Methanomethylicaceae archaeon]
MVHQISTHPRIRLVHKSLVEDRQLCPSEVKVGDVHGVMLNPNPGIPEESLHTIVRSLDVTTFSGYMTQFIDYRDLFFKCPVFDIALKTIECPIMEVV